MGGTFQCPQRVRPPLLSAESLPFGRPRTLPLAVMLPAPAFEAVRHLLRVTPSLNPKGWGQGSCEVLVSWPTEPLVLTVLLTKLSGIQQVLVPMGNECLQGAQVCFCRDLRLLS